MNNNLPITIIDSIMGSGKTSWAIQYMNCRSDMKYIYVTPYLDEINRIITACPACQFVQPMNNMGRHKVDDFEVLISKGCNIATTHVTFSRSTDAIINLIREQQYTVILDEVIEVLMDFNQVCNDRIRETDIKLLIEKKMIEIKENYQVVWTTKSYDGSQYSNVERCAKNNSLYCIDGKMLTWVFPYQLFTAFKELYIMTYLYDGSYLRPYMDYYKIPITMKSIEYSTTKQIFFLTDYIKGEDQETRNSIRELIRLYPIPNADIHLVGKTALSTRDLKQMPHAIDVIEERTFNGKCQKRLLEQDMNPFTREGKRAQQKYNELQERSNRAKRLKRLLRKYLREDMKASVKEIMWTTINDAWKLFKGNGYSKKELNAHELSLPKEEQARLKSEAISFVPCNARATNIYRNKTVLAYLYNVYVNPEFKKFFRKKNIQINEDLYAVSFLLQWIFRSAIRNRKPITLFLPSLRMTNLLNKWLDGEM